MTFVSSRFEVAQRYLLKLVECNQRGWQNSYNSIKGKEYTEDVVLTKLALLHPMLYLSLLPEERHNKATNFQEKIQGKRIFTLPSKEIKCSGIELWGYECPLLSEPLVMDHDFPYSLGGPTDNALNKRVLCRWHNMIKGSDIHIFNWEKLFADIRFSHINKRPHWIEQQLDKIIYEANL